MKQETRLHIHNMCCESCLLAVRRILSALNCEIKSLVIGEAVVEGVIDDNDMKRLITGLAIEGFSLAQTEKETLIIKVKAAIASYLENIISTNDRMNYSDFVQNQVGSSYAHLSQIFSEVEHITIEKYLLILKMEKAKELLIQNEETISNIAYALGYGSPQTFATQFKKTVGKTPSMFIKSPVPVRIHLNKIS